VEAGVGDIADEDCVDQAATYASRYEKNMGYSVLEPKSEEE